MNEENGIDTSLIETTEEVESAVERTLVNKIFSIPSTLLGTLSFWLLGAFIVLMAIFYFLLSLDMEGKDSFFGHLELAIPLLLAAISAIVAFSLAIVSIFFKGERSWIAFAAIIVGAIVLMFALGQLIGYS